MRRTAFVLAMVAATVAAPLRAQGVPAQPTPAPARPQDLFARFLFPPELVMQYQEDIGLQDSQRAAIRAAIQDVQTRFVDAQWRLSAEGEKLGRLLQGATPDETEVLDQADRILSIEREVKRAQLALLVRIKNVLTPAQQRRLTELRHD